MTKGKSKSIAANSQVKDALKQLKKLGLYNPKNPRKQPTRYAKSLVKEFTKLGVLGAKPKAEVIKVPKSVASELKGQYRVKRSNKAAVAIVPKAGGMKARYSKKAGGIVRTMGDYQMSPLQDRAILLRGGFPELKKGEAVAVRIGNNYKLFYSQDEVNKAMAEYNPSVTSLWQYPYISRIKRKR